jgi:large subunit ribosomal protein L21
MYAIIETGGKQYRVSPGETVKVERLPVEAGEAVKIDRVLAVVNDEGRVLAGDPLVNGASVTGRCLRHGRGRKIRVFKYKSKANYRKHTGHRQGYTELKIEAIES